MKEKFKLLDPITIYDAHTAIDIAQSKGLKSPGLAYQAGHIDGQKEIIARIRNGEININSDL
ncbi:MAG: hypothetical protein BWY21_02336 [Parcubacteria group bacterium ADurb.Bin216]|nr:MAG: hypothetical protein BWY21_02336 [Parcubacteria group bacterium ADurb.Bin216]